VRRLLARISGWWVAALLVGSTPIAIALPKQLQRAGATGMSLLLGTMPGSAAPLLPSPTGRGVGGEVSRIVDLNHPPRLDVNSRFADSSLVDFSFRLAPPAGHKGFLFVGSDGHFYFQDGGQARFWGINVAKDAVFVSHETIDTAAALFARAGFNLVRLHHVDDVNGLLPRAQAGRKPRIDPRKLDAVDYWIAALKKRGIYVYLDLLDYRTFWEEEGVQKGSALGRGAKPYALFNERLIQLQREYARELLIDHVNPYTGLSYAQDPAVAMIELCDENGLLVRQKHWGQMVSPYREELLRRWNFWLRSQYHSAAQLNQAWAGPEGQPGLANFENLDEGTVALPGVSPQMASVEARAVDVRRFAASLHRDYFVQMRDFLRAAGIKAPLTAVTDTEYPADLFAVATELDFIGANYYFAHPIIKDDQPAEVLAYFDAQSPLRARGPDTAMRRLCGPRVVGKPLVIREWNVCWPNQHRAAGLVEAAAYATTQDVDGMILFTYDCRPGPHKLSYFDVSADPTRWGLVALAGEVFRIGAPELGAPYIVAFSEHDVYECRDETMVDSVYEAGVAAKVFNWFPGCPPRATNIVYLRPHADQIASQILPQLGFTGPEGLRSSEISRSGAHDPMSFAAETVQGIAGNLANSPAKATEDWQVESATEGGAVMWCSLDGEVPAASRRWVIKMVSSGTNTGQQAREHYVTGNEHIHALLQAGAGPVVTGGQASRVPTTVSLADNEIVRVYQNKGSWELAQDGNEWFFYTDTPNIRFELPSLPEAVSLRVVTEVESSSRIVIQPILYPDDALLVRITVPKGAERADER